MAESLTIDINSGSKSILKVGFLIRACFILFFALGAVLLGLNFFKESLLAALICFAIGFVLFLIFFKLLNTAFFKEYLVVTKDNIAIFHKNLTNTKKYIFDISKIKYFGFAEQHYTKHPLDNPIVDFTGLATQEKELQYVIDEGNIKIETDTKNIKFGKNMPSWDVEELIEKIEAFTGKKFTGYAHQKTVNNISSEAEELINNELEKNPERIFTTHTYQCEEGELTIEQQNDLPSSDDIAYLNGNLAPTAKYKIGDKQFVLVSNGLIYAVRGFD